MPGSQHATGDIIFLHQKISQNSANFFIVADCTCSEFCGECLRMTFEAVWAAHLEVFRYLAGEYIFLGQNLFGIGLIIGL